MIIPFSIAARGGHIFISLNREYGKGKKTNLDIGRKVRDKLKRKFKYFHVILISIDIILALYINIAIICPLYRVSQK